MIEETENYIPIITIFLFFSAGEVGEVGVAVAVAVAIVLIKCSDCFLSIIMFIQIEFQDGQVLSSREPCCSGG